MIIDISSVIPAISFVPYILFTIFGLYYHREEKIRWSFILYMFVMAVWSFGSFMMHANTGLASVLFWNRFMVVGMLGGPITIFHSLLDLLDKKKKSYQYLLYLGYGIYLFLIILNLRGQIVTSAWFEENHFRYSLHKGAYIAYILSYSYLLLGIFLLSRELQKTEHEYTKKKLKLPLIGAMVMLVGVLANLYEPVGRYPVDLFSATINAFFIFYAIYKYRLVHYSAFVLNSLLYFILVVISGFVFYGILLLSFSGLRTISFEYAIIPSILLGVVAAFIFQPLRSGALAFMEKIYIGKRFEYYTGLRSFLRELNTIVELDVLGESTVQKLQDTFNLEWVMMVVLDYSSRNYKLIAQRGLSRSITRTQEIIFNRNSPFVRSFVSNINGIKLIRDSSIIITLPVDGNPIELHPALVIPLQFKKRVNGCIALGNCMDKEYFDQFDLEILEILAGQCSVTLENAISFESLKRQQKRLQDMNQELIISRNKLEAFFDGITTPISIQDINYNIITINKAAARYCRNIYENLIGKKCYNVFFGHNKPCPNCMAQDSLHTQIPFSIEQKDEKTNNTFSIHFYPISVPDGSEKIFLEFFQDITQQKILQAELAQSEKLASIGTLASGIAHEINNPLTGIIGTAEIMLQELDAKSFLREYAKDIIGYAENAAEVIQELRAYSRKEKTEIQNVNIIETIENSLKLAARGMHFEGIKVVKDYEELSLIEANRTELQQVFLNIIINAIQAMEGRGGILTIKCKQQDGNAFISIKDTGHGIGDENLDNIFNPFFTTKDPGKGTGLGLSIIHKIIHNMGGRISVESQVGVGTEFKLNIPLSKEEKQKIRFIHARKPQQIEDVFFLQRKILVGEKGYLEETIRRKEDEFAFHIVAYKGLQPVGTVSCLTPEMVDKFPIEKHFKLNGQKGDKRCVEIDRLAVLNEERGNIIPLGLMTLAYLYAKAEGAERIFLDVFSDEKKYIAMYKKLGFQVLGEYKSPLPVTVMFLDQKTDYERKAQRMEKFVRPFMARLVPRIDFEEDVKEKVLNAVDKMLSSSPSG